MSGELLDLVNPDKESLEDGENESISLLIADQMKILKDEVKKEQDKQKGDYEMKIKELKDDYDGKFKKIQEGSNEEEEEEEEDTYKLPQDTFSFFICSKPKSVAFCFASLVFAIQIAVFSLLAVNRITPKSDNPLNIPDCVEVEVLVTQVIAIIISVYVQDDLRVAFEQFFAGYSEDMENEFQQGDQQGQHNISRWKWGLSHTCRLLEGLSGLVISFFLIIAVDNVFDLLLNFTTMSFVSEFDDKAFQLASSGYFGASIQKKSQIIDKTSYKLSEKAPNRRPSWHHFIITHANIILLCLAIAGMMFAWYRNKPVSPASKCLCTYVYTQFGDNALPVLGTKSGIYVRKGGRKDYKNARAQYEGMVSNSSDIFSYSNEWEAWTFCEEGNDCKDANWKARSFQTSSVSLVRSTSASPWIAENEIQLDYFRLSCLDDDIKDRFSIKEKDPLDSRKIKSDITKQLTNECKNEEYGPFCSMQEPCKAIELQPETKGFTDPDPNSVLKYSEKYIVLRNGSTNVQSHGQPVYIGKDGEANYFDIIYFTGRRWAFSHTNKKRSMLTDYFGQGFQASAQDNLKIAFVSESVDIGSVGTAISPASLSWFYNKNRNKTMSGSRFASPDLERSVDTKLFCSFCNNNTNPCENEGHCNSNGTCTCKHDTAGSLCSLSPTGNGKCDPYFNKVEFDFDGGDCCGATCQDSTMHLCGSGLQSAFGVNLSRVADGFQECIDTSMVPITIELCIPIYIDDVYGTDIFSRQHNDHEAVSLVCDNVTYLDLPPSAFPEDAVDQCMNETVYVKDGTECVFDSTAASEDRIVHQSGFASSDFYEQHNYTIYNSAGSVLAQSVGNQSLSSSFSVISSCLLAKLSTITDQTVLEDESTPQGKAIRWLYKDKSKFSGCESNYLIQRYLLVSLDFALQDKHTSWHSWLSSESECRWNSDVIGCNQDGSFFQLDLSYQGFNMIPSEIIHLTNLVDLNLERNSLTGPISSELGKLTNLEYLELYDNSFAGLIPSELGLLTNLEYLNLNVNSLTGLIPLELGHLTNLEVLALSNNTLTGLIPSELGQLTNTKRLLSHQNSLTGPIPSELGQLTNLESLLLYNNTLAGLIASELGQLTKLEHLWLHGNSLAGLIPSELGQLTILRMLSLHGNPSLNGTLPTEFCGFEDLELFLEGTNVSCPTNCPNITYYDDEFMVTSCSQSLL